MNSFWKKYAKTFWIDEFFWEIVKAKSYTDEEIRKWSHLLRIARDYLSKEKSTNSLKLVFFLSYEFKQFKICEFIFFFKVFIIL